MFGVESTNVKSGGASAEELHWSHSMVERRLISFVGSVGFRVFTKLTVAMYPMIKLALVNRKTANETDARTECISKDVVIYGCR